MSGVGDKVVLFGSFTEDETKMFQGQPGISTSTKSAEKTWELSEIQFGSLNFPVLSSEKASNPMIKDAVRPPKSPYGQNRVFTKDEACSSKKETLTSSLTNGGHLLFNECFTASVSPNNGVLKNITKMVAAVPLAVPTKNVTETEAAVPSAVPAKNVTETEAAVPSAVPANNVTETEAAFPSAVSANNVIGTEATVPSAVRVKNIKKTEVVVPSCVPVMNVSSLIPLSSPEVRHDQIKCTQSNMSVMEISENGSTIIDAPIIAAPVEEAITGLNKDVFQDKPLLPHGLKNTGNTCFLNATLQALLSCMPFVQLLQDLRNRHLPKAGYPTLTAFVEFISQFDVLHESNMKKNEKVAMVAAKSLNPTMFDPVLRNFTPDMPAGTSARPRQEDAQEFLSFAMDRMHDELLKLNGTGSNSKEGMVVSSAEDDTWETVGRKNKSAIMRTQSFVTSELSAIFGGQIQSTVTAAGKKPSATVQPFLLLHLDIFPDGVRTLNDALHLFSTPESLEGYRTAAGKAGLVTARKLVQIHSLSNIMILHLKRFSYGNYGCTKLYKPVHFPLELVLNRDLLSSPSSESRRYELVATITHHGTGPARGHYTADAKHANGQWLRFDDDKVTPVRLNQVLHDRAYVLFYKQI